MMPRRIRGSNTASKISVKKFKPIIEAVSMKMIAPASCWSFDRARDSSNSAPASVSVRIKAMIGNSLNTRLRSKPKELMIGPRAWRAGYRHSNWRPDSPRARAAVT